jgi:hypothetical protein
VVVGVVAYLVRRGTRPGRWDEWAASLRHLRDRCAQPAGGLRVVGASIARWRLSRNVAFIGL